MAPVSLRGFVTDRLCTLEPSAFDSGGGGGVYGVVGQPALVAKVFNKAGAIESPLGRRLRAVMHKNLRDPRLARVVDLLVSPDDPTVLVGVLMERVVGHTLYSVTNPDERKLLGIKLTPLDRLYLAAEVPTAFDALHIHWMALGDSHHRNVMVVRDRRGRLLGVILIEPDTWCFQWRTNGRMERFTSMARPDFLPPEFQGVDLNRTPLNVESDRFAMVLLVCLVLFDCTPQAFAGSNHSAEERIRNGYEWLTPKLPAGAKAPDRLPIDPACVPDAVMRLLRKGLSKSPKDRPTAKDLAAALRDWHQEVADRANSRQFFAALLGLVRARTLADIWLKVSEAFLATFRRRTHAARSASGRWWTLPALKAFTLAVVVGGVAVWSSGARSPAPFDASKSTATPARKSAAPVAPTAPAEDHTWRRLIDR